MRPVAVSVSADAVKREFCVNKAVHMTVGRKSQSRVAVAPLNPCHRQFLRMPLSADLVRRLIKK